MNTNRDRLDDAIDQVVTRMVRVEENAALASQILNALPARASWFGWLFHSWAPRLAMIAIVVTAGIVWGNRKPATSPQLDPLASTRTVAEPAALVAAVQEAAPGRTTPLERVEPVEPLEPLAVAADFERSLPSLGAVAVMEFDSLAPVSLPEDAPLTLTPLAIADLPLTAEFSPRR
jgi:hypothetical protein